MNTFVFNSPEFGELRVVAFNGVTLFSVKDICNSLNLGFDEILRKLSDCDLFNECGLYGPGIYGSPYTNLDGVVDIAELASSFEGRKYRKWVLKDIFPKADKLLQNTGSSIQMSEVMACLKDVIIDYPLCAIESMEADMDLVHHNTAVLTKFYFSLLSSSDPKDSFPVSPISK